MTERRYSDEEVAEIFARATEPGQLTRSGLPSAEGMTLAELQAIGREVGIAPEMVERAARSIGRMGRPDSRRFLGFPIGVSRTVDLGRTLSEEEWHRFVVQLRETFDARGTVRDEGPFRQWTNGNLQALLEPTPTGHRLRLRTLKGDARGLMLGGLSMMGMSLVVLLVNLVLDSLDKPGALRTAVLLFTMGLAVFGVGGMRLPGWARLRRRQMEELAERLASSPPLTPELPSDIA